uniref:Uncharacterized protein n=1 Tax=Acrobeloides nanus TaxID=290746 RepID=A0A914EQZ2_9BILA
MKPFLALFVLGFLTEAIAMPDWMYFGRGMSKLEIKNLRQRCDSCSSEESDKVEPMSVSKINTIETTQNTIQEKTTSGAQHLVKTNPTNSSIQISTTFETSATEQQQTEAPTEVPIHRRLPEKLTTVEPTIAESTSKYTTDSETSIASTEKVQPLIRAKPETPAPETSSAPGSTQELLQTTFATEPREPLYLKPDLALILKKLFKGTNDF